MVLSHIADLRVRVTYAEALLGITAPQAEVTRRLARFRWLNGLRHLKLQGANVKHHYTGAV